VEEKMMMVIDVHGHIVAPEKLYAYKASLLASRGWHGRGRVHISDEELLGATWEHDGKQKTHLQFLDEAGIDVMMISPRPFHMMHSEEPESIVIWWTEEVNNVIARICKLTSGRFLGICGLPQNRNVPPRRWAEEMRRCVKELGFIGCLLNPDPLEGVGEPHGLGEEYWYPVYEAAVELDVPIIIHSAGCRSRREPYTLHFITEESIAIVSLLSSRVFEDFPSLKIIVSHGGGAIPYQVGRFMAQWLRRGQRFEENLRRMYYDTCLYTREAIELLIRVVGADRCLFGTEMPGTGTVTDPKRGKTFDHVRSLIEEISWLTEEERARIFYRNAVEVFRLNLSLEQRRIQVPQE
jgi:predicted TIM-barrel fold metal-dependent hydrolase